MDEGLTASEITVRFGGLVALDGVTIAAPRQRITGLIGPNGAGKTTMFNVCCGFQRADRGRIDLAGEDVTKTSPEHRARLGLGRTFQRMELFWSMTVRENVELAVESLHVRDDPLTQLGIVGGGRRVSATVAERAEELMEFAGIEGVADRLASEVSTGQGRLIELARALAREPQVLLLDEPSSGLDPRESAAFGELLTRLVAERGCALLMVEHDMSLVLNICDWIHVLDFGKPLTAGTPADIRASEAVREAYLGQAARA
ncbi:MAG TPA: ABC transporter ATP-binding protein [Acidimicrobiales bacterium]|jgi:ABC-type branched-subunit amino acid transport system ATPase component|nr:ABC transporter ATP-binding protein [Acidimicrobiales bacterium]